MIEPSEELKARFAHLSDEPQDCTSSNPLGASKREIAICKAWEKERKDAALKAAYGDAFGPSADTGEPLLQFFTGMGMGNVPGLFREIAYGIVALCPRNPERTVALRKLLEARDCAMRARVMK